MALNPFDDDAAPSSPGRVSGSRGSTPAPARERRSGLATWERVILVLLIFLLGLLLGTLLWNGEPETNTPVATHQASAAPQASFPDASAPPTSVGPAPSLAAECGGPPPVFEYVIDPAGSAVDPLSPVVQFRVGGLALPAEGRFYWGNDQYGIARLNQVGGGSEFFHQLQPTYEKAGLYDFTSKILDHCGVELTQVYPIAAPLLAPGTVTLNCPGTTDANGFCLVALNQPVTFALGGGPDAGWRWDADGPTSGRQLTRVFSALGEFWIQARFISVDGMLVSPVLKVTPLTKLP